jgi:hypothetical protein
LWGADERLDAVEDALEAEGELVVGIVVLVEGAGGQRGVQGGKALRVRVLASGALFRRRTG